MTGLENWFWPFVPMAMTSPESSAASIPWKLPPSSWPRVKVVGAETAPAGTVSTTPATRVPAGPVSVPPVASRLALASTVTVPAV